MLHRNGPGLSGDKIDALRCGIASFKIERRRRDLIAECESGEDRLHAAGRPEQMPRRRFGRANRNTTVAAQDRLDSLQFGGVTDRGGRRVRIEMLHFMWLKASLPQGKLHRSTRSIAVFWT